MRREILKPIGKGKQLLRIEFSTASCYFFVLNLWGKEVGHVCLKILVLMLRDLCDTYNLFAVIHSCFPGRVACTTSTKGHWKGMQFNRFVRFSFRFFSFGV